MKTFLLIMLALHSNALAMSKKAPLPVATPTPTVSPTAPIKITGNMHVVGETPPSITIKCDSSCKANEIAELPIIQKHLNDVIYGDCFAKYILNRKRIDLKNNLTNQQILDKLRTPSALTLNYYSDSDTTVDGYEQDPDYSTIHFNRKAMVANGFDLCDKASLAGHEMSHAKGFWHNGNLANPNYYTVPYTVNHAFDTEDDFGDVQSDYGACCKN